MSNQYICVRNCYYGPPGHRKLFKVGELLPAGWEPNKHFIAGAKVPPEETNSPARTPGDDSRPTVQIIMDLRMKYGIDMRGRTRKEAFAEWIKAENQKDVAVKPEPVLKEGATDPLNGRRFSDMSPDEINNSKRDDIVEAINHRFKMDMTHGNKSKVELIQYGIDLEAKQTGARAL